MPELVVLVHGKAHCLPFQPGPSLREILDRSDYRVRSASPAACAGCACWPATVAPASLPNSCN